MDEQLLYYLSFSHFLGIGPIRLKALVNYFGNIKLAYRANSQEIKKIIGFKTGDKFIEFRRKFNPVKKLEELKSRQVSVLYTTGDKYPQSLKNLEDPPICLYVKGDINKFDFKLDNFFAIVGTRNPTTYGEQVANKLAADLVKSGFVIVSGMAMGIDSVAHLSAINSNGRTIAVLGCGVNIVYPAINRLLYEKIISNAGWVISEFPPNQMVVKGLFIARNRIISGLSSGVLVVEGSKDSGTLITVRHAAEQGKEVFATPAPITSAMSEAPNLLIKQGAKLVTCVEDILEEFGMKIPPKKKEDIEKKLSNEEKNIFQLIERKSRLVDEIVCETKKSVTQVLNCLSILEIKGIIEKNKEGRYQISL